MKIGELARAAQCTVDTVRYYEREGLLPAPSRTDSNYRQYGPAHVERLRFIRNCRALDMAHEEIRALLQYSDQAGSDCSGVNALVDEHIAHVDVRIRELEQLRGDLIALRARCAHDSDVGSCGILQELSHRETDGRPPKHTHLG
ncbi:Cd(II)/Pb(II)-responsive transcriptional regulator [Uliginosibacterium sp. sgz301328]|uniref:Cd(II)/Pb(II)-responsive transcriptional regulator n=1 Tax=Uliginosibacterium sp. sgz301328 TaxID=3243764 RepID=UPI00359D803A